MRKICLIIHSIGIGGMERVMSLLATNFSAKSNTEVDLILIGRKREVVYELPESVRVHRPEFTFNNSKRSWYSLKTIWFLRRTVKEIKPDVVLSFGEYWNNLVLLTLYGLPYPIFISDRSEPGKDLGKVQNFLRSWLYPKATGYIAQTQKAKEICLLNGWNNNIRVIGNPVRKIRTNGSVQKENIVLSVGRLIKTKHFDQLIEIFVELDRPDWKLVIVGGDAKRMNLSNDLRELIHKLGAENSVFLEGEQMNIEPYYNKSKIFAFTSSSEGFPNVIGEAMSAALPIISYECSGAMDMIEDGVNGFLIPFNDKSLFKDKLLSLMIDEDIRKSMGESSSLNINRFNTEKISEQYFSFLINAL